MDRVSHQTRILNCLSFIRLAIHTEREREKSFPNPWVRDSARSEEGVFELIT